MPTVVPPQTAQARLGADAQLVLPTAGAPVVTLRRKRGVHGRSWIAVAALTDAAMLGLAALIAGGNSVAQLAMSVVVMGELARRNLYSPRSTRGGMLDIVRSSLAAVAIGAIAALASIAVLDEPDATTGVLGAWAAASLTVTCGRVFLAVWRRRAFRQGVAGRRTLIVGAGAIGSQLERRMLENPGFGMIPVGYLDADPAPDATRQVPVLGSPDALEAIVDRAAIDQVVVAFSAAPDSEVLPLLRRCERIGLEVAVVPRLFENVNKRQQVEHVGGLPLLAMRTPHPRSWAYGAKHLADRLLAAGLIVLASPVLLVTAVTVKLTSPGPVFFRQRRVGRDGRSFDILKFRSMRVADHTPDEELRNRLRAAGSAPGGVEGGDRRTPIGTLLRRTSIDELPQLLNVVRGEMSLVGPRPERPEFVDLFATDLARYGDRHRVKSGMTGWAQIHGLRGQTSLADRVEWDNWYIQNWSPWLDFKILVLTPLEIARAQAE